MTVVTEARNASLEDLAAILSDQQTHKIDVVVPASKLKAVDGNIVIKGVEGVPTDEFVAPGQRKIEYVDGTYTPTNLFDEGLAGALDIPTKYLRRMRTQRPDLYDANVNGWLRGRNALKALGGDTIREAIPGDPRSFLVRGFRQDEGENGIARAFLSSKYKLIDYLDVLTAALEGIKKAGVWAVPLVTDLSERNMRVRVVCPEVQALAPVLLDNYRNPFADDSDHKRAGGWTLGSAREAAIREHLGFGKGEEPIMFAGFEFGTSETGCGAMFVVPRIVAQICMNGLTITEDIGRKVHLGTTLDEGLIRWSDATKEKELDLIRAKVTDLVTTVTDVEYVKAKVAEIEEKAGHKLTKADEQVRQVTKDLQFSKETTESVLQFFMESGQITAGGLMNAVTAVAQTVPDADLAAEMERKALRALELAYRA